MRFDQSSFIEEAQFHANHGLSQSQSVGGSSGSPPDASVSLSHEGRGLSSRTHLQPMAARLSVKPAPACGRRLASNKIIHAGLAFRCESSRGVGREPWLIRAPVGCITVTGLRWRRRDVALRHQSEAMYKLTDTQLATLSAASHRGDRGLVLPPTSKAQPPKNSSLRTSIRVVRVEAPCRHNRPPAAFDRCC
jgi:hypothetical protein